MTLTNVKLFMQGASRTDDIYKMQVNLLMNITTVNTHFSCWVEDLRWVETASVAIYAYVSSVSCFDSSGVMRLQHVPDVSRRRRAPTCGREPVFLAVALTRLDVLMLNSFDAARVISDGPLVGTTRQGERSAYGPN
jgi:hypothetical protein